MVPPSFGPASFLFSNLSRLKLDLAELQDESMHHLAVQFSEFDITNYDPAFWIAYKLQLSQIRQRIFKPQIFWFY